VVTDQPTSIAGGFFLVKKNGFIAFAIAMAEGLL
jgi:hypothetical protein